MNLEEVAKLAGVSRSTVSRVVNGDSRVSDAARARVQQVIREHNYHPNAAARSLASSRSRIIGLLIPHAVAHVFRDPFYPVLIQGAVEACTDADYNLTMLMETAADAHITSDSLYQRVIRGRHVDGLVIAANVVEDPIIARLQAENFPFVLVGRHPRHEVSFVDVDNRQAAQGAVTHLLEHGKRRIAMIAGPRNMIASIDRYAGYITAHQEAGLLPEPDLMVYSDFTRRGGYRAMNELLAGQQQIDAVFIASDAMASGALQALRDSGIRVPDDIAVMGFDGLEETLVSRSILSTVVQPTIDEGREAVRILLELLDTPASAPIQRFLPTRLALRRSCGCGREDDLELTAIDSASGGELGA